MRHIFTLYVSVHITISQCQTLQKKNMFTVFQTFTANYLSSFLRLTIKATILFHVKLVCEIWTYYVCTKLM